MNVQQHRQADDDDEERSEGEVDSSSTDDESTDLPVRHQTSQSWTQMLTSRDLSTVMSGAMSNNSEIIHIDDPIAQQSENPLSYVFPSGVDQEEFFRRKREQDLRAKKSVRKPNRRDLKNLSHVLHNEKNEDLLRATLEILGCRRAFDLANEAIKLHQNIETNSDESILFSENGQRRTLGGIYFKMLLSNATIVSESEREQIKRHNQTIQKSQKKKRNKKKKKKKNSNNKNKVEE